MVPPDQRTDVRVFVGGHLCVSGGSRGGLEALVEVKSDAACVVIS